MLKHAGRGHDPSGVIGTKEGELCIECLACPWPGVNLPDDWKDVREDLRCILLIHWPNYVLTLFEDICIGYLFL